MKTIPMTEELYRYVTDHTDVPHPILPAVVAATEKRPMSQMQISRDQGMLMHLLVKLMGARRCLEIGCFTGYSAICVASALPENGKLVSLDIDPEAVGIARGFFKEAGLDSKIEVLLGEAHLSLDLLRQREGGESFDFVFIDADKESLQTYFEKSWELLRPSGLIVVDNVMWGGSILDENNTSESTVAVRNFNERVMKDSRVERLFLHISDGLFCLRKK